MYKASSTVLRHAAFALTTGFVLWAAGCAISETDEIFMGRSAAPQFEKEFGGLYDDPDLQDYVDRLGMRLVQYSGREDLPWRFNVLESDQINAFALPGGQVYITRGLLFRLQNEAQLAGILGHEIGHVAQRHSVEQMERNQWVKGGAALAGIVGGGAVGDISSTVAGVALMRYSRDQEREADQIGLDYLVRAGYDPNALVEALEIIGQSSQGSAPPEFLSTHPRTENREEGLRERIHTLYPDIISGGRVDNRDFERFVLRRRGHLNRLDNDFRDRPSLR